MPRTDVATRTINELREFAEFTPAEQRYIRRSLDVGLGRRDAVEVWARDPDEAATIRAQYAAYRDLAVLRLDKPRGNDRAEVAEYISILLRVTAFDLAQGKIRSFSAYRFLYERLLGGDARAWLPAAFCAASALPSLRPRDRKVLLQSISEAAATAPAWSETEPSFYPDLIDD